MRTRRLHARSNGRLGKVFGARQHPAAIAYNAKAIAQAAFQRQATIAATDGLGLLRRQIAIRYTKEWQPKTQASLVRCICHCTENSGAVPCMAKSNKKAFNRDARAARSNEPFTSVTNTYTYYTRAIFPGNKNLDKIFNLEQTEGWQAGSTHNYTFSLRVWLAKKRRLNSLT